MDTEIFYEGLDFGEGPRWHDGRLWVSDFYQRIVSSFAPTGERQVELELDDQPSGLGWLPSGELLVVAMTSRQVRRVGADGRVHVHADLAGIATGHCNDMVVDHRGNAYVGNFGYPLDGQGEGRPADLALVRADGSVEIAAEAVDFPNGSVITPDGQTLIVGESKGRRYTAFSIGNDATLSDRRVWAEVPGMAPDGCALDADGAIWMADALGGKVHRVCEGGAVTAVITGSLPAFACALGGPERRTLYILTSPGFGESISAGKAQGCIETVQVDVPGAGLP